MSFKDPALRSPYLKSKEGEKFLVVTYDPRDERDAQSWSGDLMDQIRQCGSASTINGNMMLVPLERGEDHVQALERKFRVEGCPPGGYTKIMWYFLLNRGDETEYKNAKRFALANGIQSQARNIQKSKSVKNPRPVLANVTKQYINKEGYLVWFAKITPERMPALAGKRIMTVGIDLAHTAKEGGRTKKSVACAVACAFDEINNYVTTYSDVTTIKEHSQSIVGCDDSSSQASSSMQTEARGGFGMQSSFLVGFAENALNEFGGGYLPEVVIIYRDGLTENQIEAAGREEYEPIAQVMRTRAQQLGQRPPKMIFARKSATSSATHGCVCALRASTLRGLRSDQQVGEDAVLQRRGERA